MFTCRDKKNTSCVWILSGDLHWGKIKWPLVFIIIALVDSHKMESQVHPTSVVIPVVLAGCGGSLFPTLWYPAVSVSPGAVSYRWAVMWVRAAWLQRAVAVQPWMHSTDSPWANHSSTAKHGDFLWGWVQLVDPDYNKSCLSLEKVWEEKRKL